MTKDQVIEAFRACGIEPREADLQVVELLGGRRPNVETVADYIWDHWLGEPDSPTIEDIEETIRKEIGT